MSEGGFWTAYTGSLSLFEFSVVAGTTVLLAVCLSYLLDLLVDKCEAKKATSCSAPTRFLFSVVKIVITLVSIPVTLLVVCLSLLLAAGLMAGGFILFVALVPLAVVRDIANAFLTMLWAGRDPRQVLKA